MARKRPTTIKKGAVTAPLFFRAIADAWEKHSTHPAPAAPAVFQSSHWREVPFQSWFLHGQRAEWDRVDAVPVAIVPKASMERSIPLQSFLIPCRKRIDKTPPYRGTFCYCCPACKRGCLEAAKETQAVYGAENRLLLEISVSDIPVRRVPLCRLFA